MLYPQVDMVALQPDSHSSLKLGKEGPAKLGLQISPSSSRPTDYDPICRHLISLVAVLLLIHALHHALLVR